MHCQKKHCLSKPIYHPLTQRKQNEIAKTKKEKEKGVKEKSAADKIADDKQDKPINKEAKSVNPHLAKTGKDPLSESNLERVNTSHKGKKKIIIQ